MLASSSTPRHLQISAEQVTKNSAGAIESFIPSTVTENSSFQQPKIEVNLFTGDGLRLVPFHQLETKLLDSMEISEQQPSHSHRHEASPYVFPPQRYQLVPVVLNSPTPRITSINGTSTDKDCAASSYERVSPISTHCSPQGPENINLLADSDSDDEGNPLKLKKVAYSYAENNVLAQCWIDASVDSGASNDQKKMDQLWMRISRVYIKNRPPNTPVRPWASLKAHFYTLQRQARWFSECFNRNAKLWENNKTDADIIELAQQDYKDRHSSQGFKHIGVWRLLSACPKFTLVDGDARVTKKPKTSEAGACTPSNPNLSAKTSEAGAYTPSNPSLSAKTSEAGAYTPSNPNLSAKTSEAGAYPPSNPNLSAKTSEAGAYPPSNPNLSAKTSKAVAYTPSNPNLSANEDVDAEERIRPIGQKTAEMNSKGKGKSEGLGEIKERIDKKMVGFEQYLEQKVAAILRIAQAKEYKILMKNTSNMTSEQLKIHQFMCDKIKKDWAM